VTAILSLGAWGSSAQALQTQQADPAASLAAAFGEPAPRSLVTRRPVAVQEPPAAPVGNVSEELTAIQARMGLETLANVVELEAISGQTPLTVQSLYVRLAERNPTQADLRDPYDGERYGYEPMEGSYVLRSAGPDKTRGTADDIVRDSRQR